MFANDLFLAIRRETALEIFEKIDILSQLNIGNILTKYFTIQLAYLHLTI